MQYLFIPKDHIYNKTIVEGALRKKKKVIFVTLLNVNTIYHLDMTDENTWCHCKLVKVFTRIWPAGTLTLDFQAPDCEK